MTNIESYQASHIKRYRSTSAEMEDRARFLIDYATEHGPVSVRGLYYQAEVAGLPGIGKDDLSYCKIQRRVLDLRREGRLPYGYISDATRWVRRPTTYDGIQDALHTLARRYRKSLWVDRPAAVEIWCEKDALAGVITPITEAFDVPLMVARGFCSESFAWETVQAIDAAKPCFVYYLADFDRAGQDAAKALEEKLKRFSAERGVTIHFENIGVTVEQIQIMDLPTREPKRKTEADRRWPYDFCCELDAIPPDTLRSIIQQAIELHMPPNWLEALKSDEIAERKSLVQLADVWEAA
jgi:hypothetical protein